MTDAKNAPLDDAPGWRRGRGARDALPRRREQVAVPRRHRARTGTSVGGGRRGGGKSGAEGGSRAWATLGAPRRAADRMGLDFRTGWPRRLGRRPRGESGLSRGARRAVQELLQDAPPPTPGVLPCSSPPHPVLRGPRRARHRDEHSAESRVILPHPSHARRPSSSSCLK